MTSEFLPLTDFEESLAMQSEQDYTLWHASVYFPKGSDFGMETCLDGLPYPQAVTTSTCLVIAPSLLSRATAADDNYPYPIATRI